VGPARAVNLCLALVATGNTQLKVYHKLLSNPGMRHQDLGPDYCQRLRDIRRQVAHHVGKLGALGFEVTLCRIPDSESGETRQTTNAWPITFLTRPDVQTGSGSLPRPAEVHFSG